MVELPPVVVELPLELLELLELPPVVVEAAVEEALVLSSFDAPVVLEFSAPVEESIALVSPAVVVAPPVVLGAPPVPVLGAPEMSPPHPAQQSAPRKRKERRISG